MESEGGNMRNPADEEWSVACSDDELNSQRTSGTSEWEPSPENIIQLYQILDSKGILSLEWQCPGRRSPSIQTNITESLDSRLIDDDESSKPSEPNEFDFNDEFPSELSTPAPRRRTTPASTGQKKVARFDKVIFDITRHRKLDKLEFEEAASPKLSSINKQATTHVSCSETKSS